ncbi:ribosomal large subunit pseudouridine synthase D [Alteribacillus persepolensis]|uniref:Pseudouridine synthase n=1 Tax=Alteribacillus persepolensis TaxID=568899 RepID=A0A1G7YH89_9BACI|nr:RluA family pseudouridine synthase [Alteribacillus persepolensis]SDG95734.1 ribosomal large subunit pseudouridine synthase D [Alteribacillus persepolensis]
MNKREWIVQQDDEQIRIDKFLSQKHKESRTAVQAWIKEGNVLVNGKNVKSNYIVQEGDVIVVYVKKAEEPNIQAENIALDIRYEDQDIVVVNKPRGMVVHPAPGHYSGTLVNALLYHCQDLSGINGELRPGIVHRIDKDTTGLLVAAKHDKAHEHLSNQLQNKKIERVYRAVVHGDIPHDHGTVDAPIGRDPKDRQKMAVTEKNAKEAVTHFNVLERWNDYTYIECKLETGRTHQIRVHMAYIRHPVAGDPKYGRQKTLPIQGQALHAGKLGFLHPAKDEYMEFEAPLPDDMSKIIAGLQKKY